MFQTACTFPLLVKLPPQLHFLLQVVCLRLLQLCQCHSQWSPGDALCCMHAATHESPRWSYSCQGLRDIMVAVETRNPWHVSLLPQQTRTDAMLCYAMLCYAMLCYAMLCYAMLCYAMLCYAMLCYAMPCHAMPCHAMPCHAAATFADTLLGWRSTNDPRAQCVHVLLGIVVVGIYVSRVFRNCSKFL